MFIVKGLYPLANVINYYVKRPASYRNFTSLAPRESPVIPVLANIFRANVIDVGKTSLVIEMTGSKSKLGAFIDLLGEYEILELARTGITGLSRGSKDVAYF